MGPGGKKRFEYLVHFAGWNSSWDRWVRHSPPVSCLSSFSYVLEDMLLKDNTENREQKRELDEEAVELEKTAKKLLKKQKLERRSSDRSNSRLSMESNGSTGEDSVDVSMVEEDPEEEEVTCLGSW